MTTNLELTQAALDQIHTRVDQIMSDRPTMGELDQIKQDVAGFVQKQENLDKAFDNFSKSFNDHMTKEDVETRVNEVERLVRKSIGEKVQEHVASLPEFQIPEIVDKWKNGRTEFTENQDVIHREITLCHKAEDRPVFLRANESMNVSNALVGGSVEAFPVWDTLIAGNPLRPYITVMSVGSSGFKLPQLKRGASGMQKNQAVAIPNANVAGLNMTAPTISVDDYSDSYPASLTVEEDVAGVRDLYTEMAFTDMAFAEGKECLDVLKANAAVTANDGIGNRVEKTGVAASLPTTNPDSALLRLMSKLMEAVPTAYRMENVYQLNREVESAVVLAMGQSSGYAIIPGTTIRAYNGYPMIANDHIEDIAANKFVAFFGNFQRALFMGQRSNLTIEEFDFPGAKLYYARTRFKVTIWDPAGVSVLQVKA